MTKSETEAYNLGYLKGISRGIDSAMRMKENADGCSGCAFEDVESWQPPYNVQEKLHRLLESKGGGVNDNTGS